MRIPYQDLDRLSRARTGASHGYLRGLGAVDTSVKNELYQLVIDSTQDYYAAKKRLRAAAESESIPLGEYNRLQDAMDPLDRALAELQDEVLSVSTDAQVAAWTERADDLLSQADDITMQINRLVGYEKKNRALKLGLLTAGAVVLLGGGAVVWANRRR